MPAEEVSRSLEWLCCPGCRSALALSPTVATCTACGCSANRLAPNLLGFLPGEESVAQAILKWPPEFIQRLRTWAGNGGMSEPPAQDFREQLAHHGLIRPDGSLTSLER